MHWKLNSTIIAADISTVQLGDRLTVSRGVEGTRKLFDQVDYAKEAV